MAEIIKTYRQQMPSMRFWGKQYTDVSHWDEWFANGWFGALEQAMGGEDAARAVCEDGGAYIGLMRSQQGTPDEYWIGMFAPAGAEAPAGFASVDFTAAPIGVCWIRGKESEVYRAEGDCGAALAQAGLKPAIDAQGVCWAFERYVCPRFTTPDENGDIVLDFCVFLDK